MKTASSKAGATASKQIANRITELGDWRGKTLAELRAVILAAAPDIVEDWKWGSPVWSHTGLICSCGTFKDHVKVHFFHGAFLKDPKHLFNAGLDAKGMRAIDLREGDKVKAPALKALVREAIAFNLASKKK